MQISEIITSSKFNSLLRKLYREGDDEVNRQIDRYRKIVKNYNKNFQSEPTNLFTSPGRTEICGNHTDHNNGIVLAASVNLDTIAAVGKTDNNTITLFSEAYKDSFVVNFDNLEMRKEEVGTTTSLIRGIAGRFKELGYNIGGFNAYVSSEVGVGSGLSSSASIEVLIGTIMNVLYNDSRISAEEIAIISQYSENEYFKKPCGLMDQLTIAVGGIVLIDFENPAKPRVEKFNFDFESVGYNMLVVETGGTHIDLTEDYSLVPKEMKEVAKQLGGNVCRDIKLEDLYKNLDKIHTEVGDRPILRAIHFFDENQRVIEEKEALRSGNFDEFLKLVNESGNSSWKLLQNCYTTKNPIRQGITLALTLTDKYFKKHKIKGACRVHGGGFEGTIQVFIPDIFLNEYKIMIEEVFGRNAMVKLNVRSEGSTKLM
jgi:galactokinase